MRAVSCLPEGYREICSIDLQKNKKTAVLVNGLALVIAALLAVPMCCIIPFSTLYETESTLQGVGVKCGVMLAAVLAYMALHELVHGAAMKLCGTKKVKYGFTGLYAFAGSEEYYGKKTYIFIALAPIVFWGVVLAVINLLVPTDWFWVVYFVQIANLSGAAGDLFVSVKFSRMPRDILVQDYGVGMRVFSREAYKEIL